jgi:hypothetical protein
MQSIGKRFDKENSIWVYSNPKVAQQKAISYLGPAAVLIRSKHPGSLRLLIMIFFY